MKRCSSSRRAWCHALQGTPPSRTNPKPKILDRPPGPPPFPAHPQPPIPAPCPLNSTSEPLRASPTSPHLSAPIALTRPRPVQLLPRGHPEAEALSGRGRLWPQLRRRSPPHVLRPRGPRPHYAGHLRSVRHVAGEDGETVQGCAGGHYAWSYSKSPGRQVAG